VLARWRIGGSAKWYRLVQLVQATLSGFSYAYLWPENPTWNNYAVPFLRAFIALITMAFTISFLELRKGTWFYRAFFAITIYVFSIFSLITIAYYLPDLTDIKSLFLKLVYLQLLSSVIFCILSLYVGSYLWLVKKQISARFYTLPNLYRRCKLPIQ
jgi:hypothetical protein